MNKAVILLLSCGLVLCSCDHRRTVSMEKTGDQLVIHSGKDTLVGETSGRERTKEYLLVGGSGRGRFPFTAHFSAISMAKVDRLEREHGDFLKCKSSGALESQNNIETLFLYAADDDIAAVLHEIDNLSMAWQYPVIRITIVDLKIIKHTTKMLGRDIDVDSSAFRPNYLVTDVEILRRNYP